MIESTVITMMRESHGDIALRQNHHMTQTRSIADEKLLAMLLHYVFPTSDTESLAKELLSRFGSLPEIFAASPQEVRQINKDEGTLSLFIHLIHDLFTRFHIPIAGDFFVLNNWDAVLNYCKMCTSYKRHEVFRVMYLNSQSALIIDEELQRGTLDEVTVYPRQITKSCLDYGAASVIIVHNHPGGNCRPSPTDIEMTIKIKQALSTMEIRMHDHIIIAGNDFFSFKSHGLL
jgi:DNA repair protein RadC